MICLLNLSDKGSLDGKKLILILSSKIKINFQLSRMDK